MHANHYSVTAEQIATALGGKRSGNGWSCKCPAHNDKHPSFHVSEGPGGKILVHCYAGCPQEVVIAELRAMDLWPNGSVDNPTTPEHFRRAREQQIKRDEKAFFEKRLTVSREKSRQEYKTCGPVTRHPYVEAKNIRIPPGVRQKGSYLIIPAYDANGTLQNVQKIDPNGVKRYHGPHWVAGVKYSGVITGAYFWIDGEGDDIVLCEGFATGCTLWERWGNNIAVAFSSGNLLSVTKALFRKYPGRKFTIAADDDKHKVGLHKATIAQTRIDIAIKIMVPDWSGLPRQKGDTDFNDWYRLIDEKEASHEQ